MLFTISSLTCIESPVWYHSVLTRLRLSIDNFNRKFFCWILNVNCRGYFATCWGRWYPLKNGGKVLKRIFFAKCTKKLDVVPTGYYGSLRLKGYHPRGILQAYVSGFSYLAPPGVGALLIHSVHPVTIGLVIRALSHEEIHISENQFQPGVNWS